MTGGEMAYLALVLVGVFSFMAVLFSVSSGFRDTTTSQPPVPHAKELPRGSAKAAA